MLFAYLHKLSIKSFIFIYYFYLFIQYNFIYLFFIIRSSTSSSDFLLMCRYRRHIHNSGPPSRQLACCMHGRSRTSSPGVSIMRVDSWELQHSAIPLCQLLSSHLKPPRPMLSINLYIKSCLDCIVGAFHMSIPAKPSLFQYEVQVFNAEPCKELSGPDGDSVLWFNIADLSDHCSVILLQTLEAGLC